MQLFYTPEIEPHHTAFILSEEESKHAIRVLRLHAGDTVHLIDGRGGLYKTEILDPHPKRTSLKVHEAQTGYGKNPYHLHIAIAPTKNMDRIEWFIEKATEIGISEVTPVIAEHSERKDIKTERLEKVAVAAMKQSLKAYLPRINPPVAFSKLLAMYADTPDLHKGIAHCVDAEKKYIDNVFSAASNYLLLIGPEGDFSEREINDALQAGFMPLSLGNSRLRTETAALAACLEISLLNR